MTKEGEGGQGRERSGAPGEGHPGSAVWTWHSSATVCMSCALPGLGLKGWEAERLWAPHSDPCPPAAGDFLSRCPCGESEAHLLAPCLGLQMKLWVLATSSGGHWNRKSAGPIEDSPFPLQAAGASRLP